MLHQIVMLSDAKPKDVRCPALPLPASPAQPHADPASSRPALTPQEWIIHATNWGMIVTGFLGHVVKQKSLAVGCLAASWGCFFASMRAVHKAFRRAASAARALVAHADRMDADRTRSAADLRLQAEEDRARAAYSASQSTAGMGPLAPDGSSQSPQASGPASGRKSIGGIGSALRKVVDDEQLSEVGDEVGGLDAVRESAQLALKMIGRAHWLTVARTLSPPPGPSLRWRAARHALARSVARCGLP